MSTELIRARKQLIDRLNAKKTFVERFAASDSHARIPTAGHVIAQDQSRDIVYYDCHQAVTGYGAVFTDSELVGATFDRNGLLRAKRLKPRDRSDVIVTPRGFTVCRVKDLGVSVGVEFEDCLGGHLGRALIEDEMTTVVTGRDGQVVVRSNYGPDCAVWTLPGGRTIGKSRSNTVPGKWLATEDAWHLLARMSLIPAYRAS